jgi:hypothetical protein
MKRLHTRSNSPPIKRIRLHRALTPPPSFVYNEVIHHKKTHALEQYIQKLDGVSTFNQKFSLSQYDSHFQIVDIPNDPETLLGGIFDYCLNESRKEAQKNGIEPDLMAITIRSTLLDPHIYLPYRPYTENTIDVVLNEFLKVAQSKKQQGLTLWGEPFSIKIYNVDRSRLPTTQQIIGGGKRKLKQVHHMIREKALIKVENKDAYCLFYAIQAIVARNTRGYSKWQKSDYVKRSGKWKADTWDLMHKLNIDPSLREYDACIYGPIIIDHFNREFAGQYRFKLFIFGHLGHYQPKFKYGPENYTIPIILYHNSEQKHFDAVKKPYGLFHQSYCLSCESTYNSPSNHSMYCRSRCQLCSKMDHSLPCLKLDGFHQKCTECNKIFKNRLCFQHHKDTVFCDVSKKCEKCGVIWNKKVYLENGKEGHECDETWCNKCRIWHNKEDGCFITPLEPWKQKAYRIVAFDFETTQNHPMDIKTPNDNRRQHKVNFIAAKVSCPKCIRNEEWKRDMQGSYDCEICGKNRTVTFGHRPFKETSVDYHFETIDPIESFVNWLLNDLPEKYKTHAFAHNGGRFDFMFICRELYKRRINPRMTKRGNKLYELLIEAKEGEYSELKFWDSFNLLSRPLATLVPMFDLDVQDKPYFPYLANRTDNYGRKMKTLPPKEDYLYKGFMPAKRKAFDKWYDEHYNDGFFLDEALASYCLNDVDILMAALVAFRESFMSRSKRVKKRFGFKKIYSEPHAGIDPLRQSMTIASACMKLFRMNHLKENHLAMVTDRGYDKAEKQSTIGMKFLKWYGEFHNVEIQHAHSRGGEKKIGTYQVDGFIDSENKIIEFNGCQYHGCPHCFPDEQEKMITGKTAGWHRQKDNTRLEYFRKQGYQVEVYWGCQVDQMLERDNEMKKKFDEYLDEGPIDIRSCFFGGRTGPVSLYYKPKLGEKISYYDVTSLYPYTNFMHEEMCLRGYPVGIPKVFIPPNGPKDVRWNKPEHNPYPLAILKVFITPPRKIDVPILPMKLDKKDDARLLFPLCSKCAKEYPHGGVKEDYECKHTDRQRGWVSTCTSVELNEALKNGYVVSKFYRAIIYEKEDKELFREYMRIYLAGKFHASGFDSNIKGNTMAEDQFIRETKEKFGIELDRKKMIPNKGLRETDKMLLNALWGRFGLRNYGLAQTIITDDPYVLRQHLDNRKIDVTDIDELSKDVIMITYLDKKEWTEAHESSNVVISLWTTSCARLHLLKLMQKIVRSSGCRLLYTDTDSVIYVHPEDKNPLKTSPHLGGLTDEYPNHNILEYVSGGAKQYAIKLQAKNKPFAEFEYVLKIRGMTLNQNVLSEQGLRFETFKKSVLQFANTGIPPEIPILYPNFLRPNVKKGIVYSIPLTKIYKPFVAKGIVRPSDFTVLDYGYTY